jgi:hypothetical protein
MMESAGSIVAPFIGGPLARLWTPLPSIVYAICCTLSGLSYICLPETLGQPLPDTILQADEMAESFKHRMKNGAKAKPTVLLLKNGSASLNGASSINGHVVSDSNPTSTFEDRKLNGYDEPVIHVTVL